MPIPHSIVLIMAAIGIIPFFVWLFLIAKKDGLQMGRLDFLIKVFSFGILMGFLGSALEIFILERQEQSSILYFMQRIWFHEYVPFAFVAVSSAALVSTTEELFKGVGMLLSARNRRMYTSSDGIVQGMLLGLAFAITENGVYFAFSFQSDSGSTVISAVLLRFILSGFAHIVYSGIMGMFLVEAKLMLSRSGKITFLMLAFLVPVIIHALFNFLLASQYSWLVIILIALGFLFLWIKYLRNSKKNGLMIL